MSRTCAISAPATVGRCRRLARRAALAAILGVLAFPGAAAGGQASKPSAARPASRAVSQPTTAPTTAPAGGLLGEEAHRPLVTRPDAGGPSLTWALLASVIVVIVLAALAYFVIKRLLPRLGVKVGRRIRVLETSYLGPRKAVHLLQVGSQRFLVASTRDSVTMLSEVTLAFLAESQQDGGEEDEAPPPRKRPRSKDL